MKKIYVHWFGCMLSKSEAQRMKYLLKEAGYEIVENPEEADLIVVRTCTVKTPAEFKLLRLLRDYKDKKFVLTGCLVQHRKDWIDTVFKDYSLLGVYNIDEIVKAVKETLEGKRYVSLKIKRINKLKIKSIDEFPIKIIPIQEGCLWNCKYCATKLARVLMQSFPPYDIIEEIREGIKKGLKIFYFTGTDLAVYGYDIGLRLPDLLKEINLNLNEELEGKFIRLGMANPGILNEYIDRLLKEMEKDFYFKFFHIPVQSGSNKVLQDMGRKYTVEEFIDLVDKIRKKYPRAVIATDIIVGYPTETEEDFKKTLELIENVKFDVINISRFWPRPFTEASKLKPLPGNVVKNRSRIVSKLFDKVAREINKEWVGWEGNCIVEAKGRIEGSWVCRNESYKQIIVKSNRNILGKIIKVKVYDYSAVDLRAKIVKIED